MVRIIVCRVGEEPVIEDVQNPFNFFTTSVAPGAYVEAKLFWVGKERVAVYWNEDARRGKLPINRPIPCVVHLPQAQFVVDVREGPPEAYAKSGELGFFAIQGPFIITKADNKGDHISLKDEEVRQLMPLLSLNCEQCGKFPRAYPGARFCGAGCSADYEIHGAPV